MNTFPIPFKKVFAIMNLAGDLGEVQWYDVSYHTGESWEFFEGTPHGEVLDWRYCDECFKTPLDGEGKE